MPHVSVFLVHQPVSHRELGSAHDRIGPVLWLSAGIQFVKVPRHQLDKVSIMKISVLRQDAILPMIQVEAS